MNDQDTIFADEKLLALYAALPDNLKEAIFSVNVADKIMKAGQKYGLNIEQIGTLAEATGLVMLGALHPRSYIQKLEEELGVERTKAIDIAKEINHEVFFPIRESLKNIHHMEDTQEIAGEKEVEKGDAIKTLRERGARQQTSLGTPSPADTHQGARPSSAEKPASLPMASAVKSPIVSPTAPRPAESQSSSAEPRHSFDSTQKRALFEKFAKFPAPIAESLIPKIPAKQPLVNPQPLSSPEATMDTVTSERTPLTGSFSSPKASLKQLLSADSGQIRQIPSWATLPPEHTEKPAEQSTRQQPQKVPMQEVRTQTKAAPLKIEPKQNQSVQKIPIQEIRPRPASLAEQKPGPKGDLYREPIE